MPAKRTITIVFDDALAKDMSHDQYADTGNGIWGVLKIGYPAGGFHLESDGQTPPKALNDRWDQHGGQCPWQ